MVVLEFTVHWKTHDTRRSMVRELFGGDETDGTLPWGGVVADKRTGDDGTREASART
jgi:hypothetical protein